MTKSSANILDTWLATLTRRCVRARWVVLSLGLVVFVSSWIYASGLKIRGSSVDLLPTWDETAQRYKTTAARKGGTGSTLNVVVESPDPAANQRFVDDLKKRVRQLPGVTRADVGPQEIREFYQRNRWLFVPERDLALIECELGQARARAAPGYLDLDDPCEDQVAEEYGPSAAPAASESPEGHDEAAGKKQADEPPLRRFEREMKRRIAEVDRFPTGYFRNASGDRYLLVIRTSAAGMGEFGSDALLRQVERAVGELEPARYHAGLTVGYGGDIPNAIAERDALINDIWLVSMTAVSLILLSIVVFFRSPIVLLHIGLSMGTGTALAFAAAMLAYGHLNAATSFLVAIVAGNGINHGIVYLARYRERRAAGAQLEDALAESAAAIRRGTWLAALAASGAFACLLVTSFRGFSEFGLIGGVGMIACWVATFTLLPASVAAFDPPWERIRGSIAAAATRWGPVGRALAAMANAGAATAPTASYGARLAALASQRAPLVVLAIAGILSVVAAVPLPRYLSNPWEYNFARLGSRSNKDTGAGVYSNKATEITKTRGSPVMVLADRLDQAQDLAKQLEAADQSIGGGRYIDRTETIYDYLGGPPEVVKRKLELLGEVREHIDAVQKRLRGEDARIAREWRPPETLRLLTPEELPPMLAQLFRERDGRMGTPVFAYLKRDISQSKGENILTITRILEAVRLPGDRIAPNASRASVFAAVIRSLERDAPRATLAALVLVVLITLGVTRQLVPAIAVIGSLLVGILLTVGGAAWLNVRLNFLNFIAIPLTFGICVEYAINLYERTRVYGGDVAQGIRSAGGPVFLCSLTTILGYGSLLMADNRALQSFGTYAIAGEISCILTALLVMPAALHTLQRQRTPRTAAPTTACDTPRPQ